jgi:hypothetical protein
MRITMRPFLRWTIIPTLLVGLLATTALAAIVAEVRDEAGFFSADAVRRANEVIDDIHRDFKKDLLIETFKTVPADKADEFKKLDKGAHAKFYNDWAIQRARTAKVNGVYVLIVKDPGHLQVEVGNETREKAFTIENRNKLAEIMTRKFRDARDAKEDAEKQKIYDQALTDGVRYVFSTMKSNIGSSKTAIDHGGPIRPVPVNPHPGDVTGNHRTSSMAPGLGGILCWGLLIVGIAWIVIGLIRSFTGGGGGGYGPGGYGGGGGWGGGGGFMTGLLGGMFGAVAGNWLYNNMFGSGSSGWGSGGGGWGSQAQGGEPSSPPQDTDYSGTGGDFSGGDSGGGGGDNGGGGDFGGGGDSGGGGDFGGGGGDFGGGGGDFGGGGGDFGGGGGGGGDF